MVTMNSQQGTPRLDGSAKSDWTEFGGESQACLNLTLAYLHRTLLPISSHSKGKVRLFKIELLFQ